jgi:hypothetical protein
VIFHRHLSHKIEKVIKDGNQVEVKVDIKVIKILQTIILSFRERLFYFITAMVKNKNFVGMSPRASID